MKDESRTQEKRSDKPPVERRRRIAMFVMAAGSIVILLLFLALDVRSQDAGGVMLTQAASHSLAVSHLARGVSLRHRGDRARAARDRK